MNLRFQALNLLHVCRDLVRHLDLENHLHLLQQMWHHIQQPTYDHHKTAGWCLARHFGRRNRLENDAHCQPLYPK